MLGVIKKIDEELQVVYGEVYAPNVPDSDGEFMSETEVRKMAHLATRNLPNLQIDVNHDHNKREAYVVESFISRKGDPVFLPEAWVVGVHIPDADLWELVKKGELNGFSLEALVHRTPKVLEIEVPEVINGETQKSEGHQHRFFVRFDDDGKFIGGVTDEVDGHLHSITKGTVTDPANGHTHKFSFLEYLEAPTHDAQEAD